MSFETKFLKLTNNIDRTKDFLSTDNVLYYDDVLHALNLARITILSANDCLDELDESDDTEDTKLYFYRLSNVLTITDLVFETSDLIKARLAKKVSEYHD